MRAVDRRRAAFFVTAALVSSAGCASVLGLEDRHLEANSDPESGVAESSIVPDASADTSPSQPCAVPGPPVFAFRNDAGSYAYVTDDAGSGLYPGFVFEGRVFALVPITPGSGATVFYLAGQPTNADYLVTPHPEGEETYAPIYELPGILVGQREGTRPIVRGLFDGGPTKHRLFLNFDAGDDTTNWTPEHVWYVCP